MEQTRRQSMIETCVSTFSGFWISYFTWIWIIAPVFGLPITAGTNFLITCIFTVVSLLRGYGIRRLFASGTWAKAISLFGGKYVRD